MTQEIEAGAATLSEAPTARRTGDLLRDFAPGIPGEPVMVPRPDSVSEDDGWILTVVYHGSEHRSALYILDARDLSTVCVAELPHHVPPGFHGTFVPSAACPPGWN